MIIPISQEPSCAYNSSTTTTTRLTYPVHKVNVDIWEVGYPGNYSNYLIYNYNISAHNNS